MKVIFLDVDGVLNSKKTATASGGFPHLLDDFEKFDMHAIKLLQNFCNNSGVKIVISSAWRTMFSVEDFKKAWKLPVISCTPIMKIDERGKEIKKWLESRPNVTHFVILDDTNDMLEEQMNNFVLTDPDEGLTWKDFLRMCNILEESPTQGGTRERDWMIE